MEMVLCATTHCKARPDNTSRAAVAGWLATPDSQKLLRKLARKFKSLACADADDLLGDAVVMILECDHPPEPGSDGFVDWLTEVVKTAAGKSRDAFLRSYAPALGDGDAAVAEAVDDEEPPFENARDMANFLKARAARVRRVLAKLPAAQREAVRSRFFAKENLAEVARTKGLCDSAERMNLLRAKAKLAALLDRDGYAVAA
jgi:RNA polymerase sigma factor (sigma-70 family)